MGWLDKLRDLRYRLFEPDIKELYVISEQAGTLLSVLDVQGLTDLLLKYRLSVRAVKEIATRMAGSALLHLPPNAADPQMKRLFDTLCTTRFMQQRGTSLRNMGTRPPDRIDGLLATYVLMLNVDPKRQLFDRIDPLDIRAAQRVFDSVFKESTSWELGRLAMEGVRPSPRVLARYMWEEGFQWLEGLRKPDKEEDEYDRAIIQEECWQREGLIERQAELRLEALQPSVLPKNYLNKLTRELDHLAWMLHYGTAGTNTAFLYKHAIDPQASAGELRRQIAQALRIVDTRIVLLSGRRPYADILLGYGAKPTFSVRKSKISVSEDKPARKEPSQRRGRKK